MSTYAVFGMTREWAVQHARKVTLLYGENGMPLTEAQWLEKCGEEADKIMEGKRSVRLSPMFDAPAFAFQFLELAKCIEHRDLRVRAYAVDEKQPLKPNGKDNYVWQQVVA